MNFFRKHSLLISMGTIFFLLLGGSLYLLNEQIASSDAAFQELEAMRDRRQNLWNEKVILIPNNIKKLRDESGEIEKLVESALGKMESGLSGLHAIEGARFQTTKFKSLRQMAHLLHDQNSIEIPEKFQFGFERYQNKPPLDGDTLNLQKQLAVIEELMQICAHAQVRKILSVRRVEFESQSKVTPQFDPAKQPMVSLGDQFIYWVSPPGKYLYNVMPFELVWTGDTKALNQMLKALSLSKFILLPRILKVDNEVKTKLSSKDKKEEGDQPEKSEGMKKGESGERDPFLLPLIIGKESITVGMRIDWIELIREEKGDQKKTQAKSGLKGKPSAPKRSKPNGGAK